MERCRKNRPDCPWRDRKLGCHVIKHHLYWPESDYTEPLEREFRELDVNRVEMCKQDEENVHRAFPNGPPKPTLEVMNHIVERERLKRSLRYGTSS